MQEHPYTPYTGFPEHADHFVDDPFSGAPSVLINRLPRSVTAFGSSQNGNSLVRRKLRSLESIFVDVCPSVVSLAVTGK
jgi:hypothetical protein